MNRKSFAKLVGIVAILLIVVTLIFGGSKDANTFGFVGLLVAVFFGLPTILVITLYRYYGLTAVLRKSFRIGL